MKALAPTELLTRLSERGIIPALAPCGEHLDVTGPRGSLTPEVVAELRAHKDLLIAWLRRLQTPTVPADPRPDLADDAAAWGRVLALAWQRDGGGHCRQGGDRCSVYGALLGMRCLGVRLEQAPHTLRLRAREEEPGDPPRWVTPAQYAAERRRWLDPHREAVIALLAAAGA